MLYVPLTHIEQVNDSCVVVENVHGARPDEYSCAAALMKMVEK